MRLRSQVKVKTCLSILFDREYSGQFAEKLSRSGRRLRDSLWHRTTSNNPLRLIFTCSDRTLVYEEAIALQETTQKRSLLLKKHKMTQVRALDDLHIKEFLIRSSIVTQSRFWRDLVKSGF